MYYKKQMKLEVSGTGNSWLGHVLTILRHVGLLKDIFKGKMIGKLPKGRKRLG